MNKKIYLLGLCAAASAAVANAQQLPNVGFDNWKATNGTTILTSTSSSGSQTRPGSEPEGWNASNINQILNVITCTKGQDNSNENVYVSLKNYNAFGNIVPAYMVLGTPWVFAHGSGLGMMTYAKYGDGGCFGGVDFSYKPDAVQFKYRKPSTTEEISHIIVYLWNGSFKSNVPSEVTSDGVYTYGYAMDDVDRVVFGRQQDENVTDNSGKLIAKIDYEITTTENNWTPVVADLEYVGENASLAPEKVNVILAASDYWTRPNLQGNTQLDVDDVDFVYYSTEAVTLEDGEYEYAMSGSVLPTEEHVVATTKSQFAKAAVTVDAENAQVRIVVTNQGGKDVDGETSHTYTLQYEKAAEPEQYQGYLNIEMAGSSIAENQAATIEITETGEGKCTFVLPDFQFGEASLGDIVVENVTVTENEDGLKTYEGITPEDGDLVLVPNMITASVSLSGTIDASGNCDFDINVLWKEQNLPINVTFTTNEIPAGVEGINGDAVTVYGMAGAVAVSGYSGAIEVYTADGRLVKSVMVDGNAEIALDGGLYIVRAGGEAYKVFVK